MTQVRVKICGLTRLSDALAALDAGVDALGFNLAEGSPRRLDADAATALVDEVRARASRPFQAVAVLGAYDADAARHVLTVLGFDRVQLVGGDEEPLLPLRRAIDALGDLAGRTWGAIRVRGAASLEGLEDAGCEAIVLDGYRAGALGGTGQAFDWTLAAPLAARARVLLAGGLTPGNVAAAIRAVQPWGVDVASGVEEAPGVKSAEKIRAFVEAARHGKD